MGWGLLLGILLLGLILRLGVLALHQPWQEDSFRSRNLQGDAVEYHRLARNLSEGHGFSRQVDPPYSPDALRTPLYPGFVAGIFRLAGPGFLLPALLQIVLALLTIALLTRWSDRELGVGAATVAGLLMGLDIDYAHLNVTLWSETLYLAFLVPALIAWTEVLQRPEPGKGAVTGVWLGLASLTRPAAVLLAPLAALLTLWSGWLGGPSGPHRSGPLGASRRESGFWAAVLLGLIAMAVTAPWVWRNYETFGLARLSSSAGWNLLHVHAARTLAAAERVPVEAVERRLDARVDSLLWEEERGNPLARSELEAGVALDVITSHPAAYARLQLAGMANLLLSPGRSRWILSLGGEARFRPVARMIAERGWIRGLSEAARGELWITIAAVVRVAWLLALYALAAIGFVELVRKRRAALWLPLAVYTLYALVLAGPLGDSRFRVTLLPALVFFAGAGWSGLSAWWSGRLEKRSLPG